MFAKTVKVVGLAPKRDKANNPTGYYTYHCTGEIGANGVGTAVFTFSSKAEYKLGQTVHIVYAEKVLPSGERFKTWEVVNF